MGNIKILELTNYSSGICGVWNRVKNESILLNKKYDVHIFTSNSVKGTEDIAKPFDCIESINVKRFPFKKLGGESFMKWNFEKQALKLAPDIIITHSYRHPHTTKALSIREKLKSQGKKCKVFLVTHAPFIEKNQTRSLISKSIVKIYDWFMGPKTLNSFDKVITICKWEVPYLLDLGCKKYKIIYIPNGIPDDFFTGKRNKGIGILFFGRISPIKNLELLIKAIKGTDYTLSIVGPAEEDYLQKLKNIIKKENINNINFLPPIMDIKKKIAILDKHEIFVLPSISEASPQSLIEAMARGKIVVSSDTKGGKEIIENKKNGFLFSIGNEKELKDILNSIKSLSNPEKEKISKEAINFSKNFKWSKVIKILENLIEEEKC
jgi:glycosyltransferase involved in cell wall biosynthesis